ncbi:hypothetical protein D3C78_1567410 [compost metagenome]
MAWARWLKSAGPMSSTLGRIRTSARASSASPSFWPMMAIDWPIVPSRCSGTLPLALLEMSTATTRSAPSWRAASTGTGLVRPPSTKWYLPIFTGWNTPGMLLDARTAWPVLPRANSVRSPSSSRVATATKGLDRRSSGLRWTCRFT